MATKASVKKWNKATLQAWLKAHLIPFEEDTTNRELGKLVRANWDRFQAAEIIEGRIRKVEVLKDWDCQVGEKEYHLKEGDEEQMDDAEISRFTNPALPGAIVRVIER